MPEVSRSVEARTEKLHRWKQSLCDLFLAVTFIAAVSLRSVSSVPRVQRRTQCAHPRRVICSVLSGARIERKSRALPAAAAAASATSSQHEVIVRPELLAEFVERTREHQSHSSFNAAVTSERSGYVASDRNRQCCRCRRKFPSVSCAHRQRISTQHRHREIRQKSCVADEKRRNSTSRNRRSDIECPSRSRRDYFIPIHRLSEAHQVLSSSENYRQSSAAKGEHSSVEHSWRLFPR